jgi:hypothetical protein
MEIKTRVLLVSLALNLALIGLSVYALVRVSESSLAPRSVETGTSSVGALKISAPEVPVANLSADLMRLRGLGLSVEETMPIILDRLRRSVYSLSSVEDKYWESDWQSASREAVVARSHQSEAIRAALLSLYGPDAESAAPFHDLFRPLDATLPFLSPAEQRALVQFRLARASAGPPPFGPSMPMPAAVPASPPNMPAVNRVPLPGSHAEFVASLPSALSKKSAFEVALRESPLAARLRSARADLTESEFRLLFTAMADAERDRVPLSLELLSRQVPRAKALKVVSQGDPAWLGLQSAASRLSLSEQQVVAIYDAVRQTCVFHAIVNRFSTGW